MYKPPFTQSFDTFSQLHVTFVQMHCGVGQGVCEMSSLSNVLKFKEAYIYKMLLLGGSKAATQHRLTTYV